MRELLLDIPEEVKANLGNKHPDETSPIDIFGPRFKTQVLDSRRASWITMKKDVIALEKKCFKRQPPVTLYNAFCNSASVMILLKDGANNIVGYLFAAPHQSVFGAHIESLALPPDMIEDFTIPLMRKMDRELASRGYPFMEVEIERNGIQSSQIAEEFAGRITASGNLFSRWGAQTFFRIHLTEHKML